MLRIKPTKETSIQNYGEGEDEGIYVFNTTEDAYEIFGPFFMIEFSKGLILCWENGEEAIVSSSSLKAEYEMTGKVSK